MGWLDALERRAREAAAELLLERMLAKIEDLCDQRDWLNKEQGGPTKGRVLGGRSWWCASNWNGTTTKRTSRRGSTRWLRQRATREGHCYQHVQAITVAIDQYAEKALGNRDYFLNKPYGVG
jgi:hypothetical protein